MRRARPRPPPGFPRPLALACILTACSPRAVPDDSTSTGAIDPTTTSSTSDALPTSTTTSPTTGTPDPNTTTNPATATFVVEPDLPPGPVQCNPREQLDPECRPGQKCTIDGTLQASQCVDIVDDPKGLYEPCTMAGDAFSGFDDCDLGLLCWYLDDQGHGICIGLADGPVDPTCIDPSANLSLCQDCLFGYCFPGCDPLLQNCPGTSLCVPDFDAFTCFPDASGFAGQTNDPCEFVNACDKGLACVNSPLASSACMQEHAGCCQPFCDLDKNLPCPNPDQKCIQWFTPSPPGLEHVGVCQIPP